LYNTFESGFKVYQRAEAYAGISGISARDDGYFRILIGFSGVLEPFSLWNIRM